MKKKRYRNDNLISPLTIIAIAAYVLYNLCTNGVDGTFTGEVILKASIIGWVTYIASIYIFGEETNGESNVSSMMNDIGF